MDKQFSSLICDVYDAALDPSGWMGVLEKCAKFVSAFAVTLQDRAHPGAFEHHLGLDPYYQDIYVKKFSKTDPRTALDPFFKAGEIFSTFAVLHQADFRDTPLYQEYIEPQGISDNIRCVFAKSPVMYFGLFRRDDDGPPKTTSRRMRLLMPHLQRAMQIRRTVNSGHAEAASFCDTLDGLRAGIFLLDARHRVAHANASGHDMLAQKILLRAADGSLSVGESNVRRMLDRGMAAAAKGDPAVSGKGHTMPLNDGYVAHLLPLTAGERRRTGVTYDAVAALFVHSAEPKVSIPCERVAARYNLTPMEVTVLFAIVDVGGVPEVAKALGIAPTTVKTHLLRVFAKTNTRRQADLVKLVFEFANPLVR